MKTGDFLFKYEHSESNRDNLFSNETTELFFKTNIADVNFHVKCGCLYEYSNLEVLKDIDYCIFMFDTTNKLSFEGVKVMINILKNYIVKSIPFVLRNKVDSRDVYVSKLKFKSF